MPLVVLFNLAQDYVCSVLIHTMLYCHKDVTHVVHVYQIVLFWRTEESEIGIVTNL